MNFSHNSLRRLLSIGRTVDPTHALHEWNLREDKIRFSYVRKTYVYVWFLRMHNKVDFIYKTWIMIMHMNYIYDFLMGLLSICGGMGLHVYIS